MTEQCATSGSSAPDQAPMQVREVEITGGRQCLLYTFGPEPDAPRE